MNAPDLKKKVLTELVNPNRTVDLFVKGKTPSEVYALYTAEFEAALSGVAGSSPELIAELKSEAKAVIGLVWPGVRQRVLAQWGAERRDAQVAQKAKWKAEGEPPAPPQGA